MKTLKKILGGLAVFLVILIAVVYFFRAPVTSALWGLFVSPPLIAQEDVALGENETWLDDYHTIEKIDETTYALNEPRFFQDNLSYLIIGEDRALLFDTGNPGRDITGFMRGLTDKPITVMPSHMHYDHTGSLSDFDGIVVADTDNLKDQAEDDLLTPTHYQYMGIAAKLYDLPTWKVDTWVKPGDKIELGGRTLIVVATPGHTPESVSLYDPAAKILFAGDYLHQGEVYAFMPNSRLQEYLDTTEQLLKDLPTDVRLYAGHGVPHRPDALGATYQDMSDLKDALVKMRDGDIEGTGILPRVYDVNDKIIILTDIPGPDSPVWDFRAVDED